ncbi:PKD domain-containing protein [Aliikangiella coralliicola]|uniref:Tandem-95 repeat protein n=1 Tax=Aliikangiella coralliicola TaxID=2592383 RepID=A0A545UC63_9GAMM|nr:Ig-like domain-containing protein [Aliikangiella coralliicola]TQV87050.1 hypothetical protein FLL46_14690 [Aliikangiella coralliicola]
MRARNVSIFLLALFSFSAGAANHITMDSDSGDWIGKGLSYDFSDESGTFSVTKSDSQLRINYRSNSSSEYFRYEFVAPDNRVLERGGYVNAQRAPFRGPMNPGLSATGNYRGCNTINGYFYIYEYETDGSLPVISLDFVQFCDSTSDALRGSIRINTDSPIPYPLPFSVIQAPSIVVEGQPIAVNGEFSKGADGLARSFEWAQVSGPSVNFSAVHDGLSEITLNDPIKLGGEDVVIGLTVTDDLNQADTSTMRINVKSKSDPHSYFRMSSEPGDYIGRGLDWSFDEADSLISIRRNYDKGVTMNIRGGSRWSADFAAADEVELFKGVHSPATRFPFQAAGEAGLSVTGDGRGCNRSYGWFEVLDMEWNGQTPTSFKSTFEQHCGSQTAPLLSGEIGYNTVHASVPTAEAGPDITINEGATVSLDGSNSVDVDGRVSSYFWTIDNENVQIKNADTSCPTFIAPQLENGASSMVLTATLLVVDDLGYQAKDEVLITVIPNESPIAKDDALTLNIGQSALIYPLQNDTDADGSLVVESLNIINNPTSGKTFVESGGYVLYKHTGDNIGQDYFTYQVNDNSGSASNTAKVRINITNGSNLTTSAEMIEQLEMIVSPDIVENLNHSSTGENVLLNSESTKVEQPNKQSVSGNASGGGSLALYFLAFLLLLRRTKG